MPDLAIADVTYTPLNLRRLDNGLNSNRIRLAFGDSALTVPANGIPLDKGKLGCKNEIQSLRVVDQGTSGYTFQYDQSAEKLVVIHSDHAHDLLIIGGGTIVSDGGLGADSAGDLVKVEAANLTIEGSASAADGGVISGSSASEASTLAIAVQTIEVEVIGW